MAQKSTTNAEAARFARRSATAEQILDLAETFIQTRSYSAFSYQDIADELGIKKASIHYHFASKAELGVAVIERYTQRIESALDEMGKDQSKSSVEMLDFYARPYLAFAKTPNRICLSGALAGEMMALPPEIREKVNEFFKSHQAWLAAILDRGVARKEFKLKTSTTRMARLIFNALQGSLLVKRTTGEISQVKDVIALLKSQLSGAER